MSNYMISEHSGRLISLISYCNNASYVVTGCSTPVDVMGQMPSCEIVAPTRADSRGSRKLGRCILLNLNVCSLEILQSRMPALARLGWRHTRPRFVSAPLIVQHCIAAARATHSFVEAATCIEPSTMCRTVFHT